MKRKEFKKAEFNKVSSVDYEELLVDSFMHNSAAGNARKLSMLRTRYCFDEYLDNALSECAEEIVYSDAHKTAALLIRWGANANLRDGELLCNSINFDPSMKLTELLLRSTDPSNWSDSTIIYLLDLGLPISWLKRIGQDVLAEKMCNLCKDKPKEEKVMYSEIACEFIKSCPTFVDVELDVHRDKEGNRFILMYGCFGSGVTVTNHVDTWERGLDKHVAHISVEDGVVNIFENLPLSAVIEIIEQARKDCQGEDLTINFN